MAIVSNCSPVEKKICKFKNHGATFVNVGTNFSLRAQIYWTI